MYLLRSDTEAGRNALEHLLAGLSREDKAYYEAYLADNPTGLLREMELYPERYLLLTDVEQWTDEAREQFMSTPSPAIPLNDIVALERAADMLEDRCGGPGDCGRWLKHAFLPFLRWYSEFTCRPIPELTVSFQGWDTCFINGSAATIIELMNYSIRFMQDNDQLFHAPFGGGIGEFDADDNGVRLWWD